MILSRFKYLARFVIGLVAVAIPLFAFLSAHTLPSAENIVYAEPPAQSTAAPLTTEETQTAVAATETSFAITVQAAGTQTAVAGTQTAIPGTQTAVAGTQTAVAQPSSTSIYVDFYEPNNTLQTASTVLVNQTNGYCNLTLWPYDDVDYFRFVVKAGLAYEAITDDLDEGIDTYLTIYNSNGTIIGENDDAGFGLRESAVAFSASIDGYYYAKVNNLSPGDPANQTYCFEVNEIQGTATPTPIPTGTRVPGADLCEENGSFGTACLIGAGEVYDLNFVPLYGEGPDNDFFRLWVKQGIYYACETFDLSSVNDTNMILYDQNGNGLAGNDDKEPGDFGSLVGYYATYTGWLYILVGPYAVPEYELSYLYDYSLTCEESAPTPTPTASPTNTPIPSTGGGGGGVLLPTPTAIVFPTFPPTPTAIVFETPQPTARPVVQIVPLPTNTPVGSAQQTINLNMTVYYDSNGNFMAELTEGVEDLAVALYDNSSGELLAFGYTNEAGAIRFGTLVTNGAIRISIPFLSYEQVIATDANIFIRVAPLPDPNP